MNDPIRIEEVSNPLREVELPEQYPSHLLIPLMRGIFLIWGIHLSYLDATHKNIYRA